MKTPGNEAPRGKPRGISGASQAEFRRSLGQPAFALPSYGEVRPAIHPRGIRLRTDSARLEPRGILAKANKLVAVGLRCEYRVNPLGIDEVAPRLSWVMHSGQNRMLQAAYRVLVASSRKMIESNRGDLWDSGRIESDQSIDVRYSGKALKSRGRCFWKVKVWDNHGGESRWSEAALWSMGLIGKNDWHSQWIGLDKEPYAILRSNSYYAPCYFRNEFSVKKKVAHATLYASALGWYIFHINGKRVGNDYFTPGWTDPRIRIYYNTYDVSGLIRKGANAIGGALSGGWYHWPDYGEKARLMGQLEIYYTDGSRFLIVTGKSWAASEGPEKYAHILYGEACDSRKSIAGWDKPGFNDSKWEKPQTRLELDKALKCLYHSPARPVIEAYPGEPVRVYKERRPIAITNPVPGEVFIFDMGANYAGFVRIRVKGAPRGQAIRLRFGDWLNRDGSLYNENLRGARPMMDEYICSGRAEEIWEPRFTFRGHRYVEVTGWPDTSRPGMESITGIELTQDATCSLKFTCGSAMLNKLHEAIAQTRRANTIEAPTDCSQRNERQGWCGDALLFSRTANYLADMQSFYRKWLKGVLDAQHKGGGFARLAPGNHGYYSGDPDGMPGWADLGVLLPWILYQYYGDVEILEKFYPAIGRYVDFRVSTLKKYLRDEAKFYYGDWNSMDSFWNAKTSEWGADSSVAYAAYTALTFQTASYIAGILGHGDDAVKYRDLFSRARRAFNNAYVSRNGMKHPTQGNCALALSFGLVEGSLRKKIAGQLVNEFRRRDWNTGAGILSAGETLFALSGAGHVAEALNVLLKDTFPSWGYMMKCGSPAIWEHWGSQRPELPDDAEMFDACASGVNSGAGFTKHISPAMNSGNHPAFGSVGRWIYENVGGISPAAPGFKKIVIKPLVDERVGFADMSYNSVYGLIRSSWKIKGARLAMKVEIPANTTAEIYIPSKNGKVAGQSGGRRNVIFLRREAPWAVYAAGSGVHAFESRLPAGS